MEILLEVLILEESFLVRFYLFLPSSLCGFSLILTTEFAESTEGILKGDYTAPPQRNKHRTFKELN